jgi:catechol 2,3-dioxygenase-like lactoylglutathione lyase family enzyme
VTALHHVTLELRREDAERCVAFYKLLGFRTVEPPESLRDRAEWMQAGATQVHLMWVDEPVVVPRGHVAVVVDDYEQVLVALADAGHETERRREHWGSPRSYVHDPAGHLVELMAFSPQAGASTAPPLH